MIVSLFTAERKFIEENRGKAIISGNMFKNFKAYVNEHFPNGIKEDSWDSIMLLVSPECRVKGKLFLAACTVNTQCKNALFIQKDREQDEELL